MDENRGLERFLEAQVGDYDDALSEISAGEKQSHWIWYVFPQLKGLGMSWTSEYYGITDLAEAKAYLAHPVLGKRLREITCALLAHRLKPARDILGYPDDLKVCSCMTLFDLIEPNGIFAEVLDVFYGGRRDEKTLGLLQKLNNGMV